ncbi:MAG: four helix bundle protein [Bacteroidales bacterium]
MGQVNSYKDLQVWQKSMEIVIAVYSESKMFPANEQYGLVSQMRRSAISIPANIAEGYRRNSSKSYAGFLKIARGSLYELETELLIAEKLNYIQSENKLSLFTSIEEVGKMLNSLIKKIENACA